jgi:hypothetical protein
MARQIDLTCAPQLMGAESPTAEQQAAVRAFSSNFSITHCDAVYGRSLSVARRLDAVRPALACGLAARQA